MTSGSRGRFLPLAAFAVLLAVGVGGWFYMSHGTRGIGRIGGPFTLVNGTGHAVTDRDLRGRYLLVYFGYTFCPDVCPTTLNTIAHALDALGKRADRLQPVFITVDPHRDTPAVIAAYTKAFSSRILGLTGTPGQIARVAREYRVYYAKHRTGDGPDDYSMDHSSLLYLVGPDGAVIAPLVANETAKNLAAAIARHMAQG